MQPNNPLTDLNIRSLLVCYVYARAVVKSTIVESKTSLSPGLSSPSQDRVERGSSPSQDRVQRGSRPSQVQTRQSKQRKKK